MDILVRVNKRLNIHESSKGVIFMELARLNQIGVNVLFECSIKNCQKICQQMKQQGITDYVSYIKQAFGPMLQQDMKNMFTANGKLSVKIISEGTTAVYIEGRPVEAGPMSKIATTNPQDISNYLLKLLRIDVANMLQLTS